jgi:protein-disulfide isomerase
MPAAIDHDGSLAKKVKADYDLGSRLGVEWTPTIVVVTRSQYQAVCGTADGKCDPTQILQVVQGAMAQAK